MSNFTEVLDITGHRYGKLTCLKRGALSNTGRPRWVFKCDCGAKVTKKAGDIRWADAMGGVPSCGCTPVSKTSLMAHYRVYVAMVKRCRNPNDAWYERYGGRGINVCKRWLTGGFNQFWADMGPTYTPGLTLDRKNNDRGYMPSNCRWATYKEQANNRRNNLPFDALALAAAENVTVAAIYNRHYRKQPLIRRAPQQQGPA